MDRLNLTKFQPDQSYFGTSEEFLFGTILFLCVGFFYSIHCFNFYIYMWLIYHGENLESRRKTLGPYGCLALSDRSESFVRLASMIEQSEISA